jgi:hypothetical protein
MEAPRERIVHVCARIQSQCMETAHRVCLVEAKGIQRM